MMTWQELQHGPAVWRQWLTRMFVLAGQNRSLVIVVNLLLIVWLAHNLAGLSWRLLPNADQQAIPVVMPIDAPRQQQQALNIARWHLFGNIEARPVVSAQRVEDMPVTRLKLILRGVVSGGNGSMSGAIIADPSGKQSFYVLGADLPGGAILKEVHERNIVLLRNGQLETLQLPSDQLNDLDESTPDTEPLPDVNASSALTDQPLMSLIEYRDTLLQNPQQLADVVQARPYNRNGVSGYQINPGRDAALFSQLGLQPNDVITEVNGIKLDNPARGLNVLQTLQQDGPVMVEVLRGGVSQTLTVDLNQ